MSDKKIDGVIDELLREDQEVLKQKRARLRGFASALDEVRGAVAAAQESAMALLDAGDLSRSDLAKVFALTRAEKSLVVPGRSAATESLASTSGGGDDAAPEKGQQAEDQIDS